MADVGAAENTDVVVHVFKESDEPFAPQNTVFVTQSGGLGICFGGHCIVKHPRDWHALAVKFDQPNILKFPVKQ